MPGFIRANIGTVLPLLQAQLMAQLNFPVERVVVQKQRDTVDVASFQGDQYVVLKPDAEGMNRRQIQSAGRHDARVDRRVVVMGFSRLNLDVSNQDYSWLLDGVFGEQVFESSMINALMTWMPTDSGKNVLAVPTRCESITPPATGMADWGSAAVYVNYQMYRDVNQGNIFTGAL